MSQEHSGLGQFNIATASIGLFLEDGRKLENPVEAHMDVGRWMVADFTQDVT